MPADDIRERELDKPAPGAPEAEFKARMAASSFAGFYRFLQNALVVGAVAGGAVWGLLYLARGGQSVFNGGVAIGVGVLFAGGFLLYAMMNWREQPAKRVRLFENRIEIDRPGATQRISYGQIAAITYTPDLSDSASRLLIETEDDQCVSLTGRQFKLSKLVPELRELAKEAVVARLRARLQRHEIDFTNPHRGLDPTVLGGIAIGVAGAVGLGLWYVGSFETWLKDVRNPTKIVVVMGAAALGGFGMAVQRYTRGRRTGLLMSRHGVSPLTDAGEPAAYFPYETFDRYREEDDGDDLIFTDERRSVTIRAAFHLRNGMFVWPLAAQMVSELIEAGVIKPSKMVADERRAAAGDDEDDDEVIEVEDGEDDDARWAGGGD